MKLKYLLLLIIFLIPLQQSVGQWISIGLESEGISSIVIDPHNPNIIYANCLLPAYSAGVNGVFKSTDGGIHWDTIYHSWVRGLAIHPDSSNILYATSTPVTVLKTVDAGETWFESDSGIILGVECVPAERIYVSPKKPEIIYAGTSCTGCGTIYRSTDSGRFWTVSLSCATAVGIDPDSNHRAYIGTAMACDVYRSTDSGSTWINTGFQPGIARGFAFGKPSSIIYLATSSGSFPKGIFRSTDAGITWANIGDGIPGIRCDVNCIVNNRTKNPDEIYIGANTWASFGPDSGALFGVFRSTDGGTSWIHFGLDSLRVHVLTISPDGNTLYAGILFPTYGYPAGIYKRDLTTAIKETPDIIHDFTLSVNYPNPFNPSTEVSFVIGHLSFVTLKVYDVLGREVAVLVDEKKVTGEYNVTWNAEGVPSGVYFYRIVAGDYIETKKMVVMK